jgi:CBS domain-containing protein
MKVSVIISEKPVYTIEPNATLAELVDRLNQLKIGALVVSQTGADIKGIASERDLLRHMSGSFDKLANFLVTDIMTKDVYTCTEHATVAELMNLMTNLRIRHIPVVDEDHKLISIVSIGDVVKARIDEIDEERKALTDYITS